MTRSPSNVVRLKDRRPPIAPARKSQYERYPLPFFAAEKLSTWAIEPTGDFSRDDALGKAYALEFLASCDGTVGWASLLSQIVGDMIRAGPIGVFPDGHPKINGVVSGFMRGIGGALAVAFKMNPSSGAAE